MECRICSASVGLYCTALPLLTYVYLPLLRRHRRILFSQMSLRAFVHVQQNKIKQTKTTGDMHLYFVSLFCCTCANYISFCPRCPKSPVCRAAVSTQHNGDLFIVPLSNLSVLYTVVCKSDIIVISAKDGGYVNFRVCLFLSVREEFYVGSGRQIARL